MRHHVILGYTTNDDGVWLECIDPESRKYPSCGWEHHLGFHATPQEAFEIAQEHLEQQIYAPR